MKDATGFITEKHEDVFTTPAGDSLVVTLPDKEIVEKNIPHRKLTQQQGEVDRAINELFRQPWNPDHFGPVRVPEGKYFLLGDNRHRAMDSRYIGFVDKKDWVATVLW